MVGDIGPPPRSPAYHGCMAHDPTTAPLDGAAARLRQALSLFDTGVAMHRLTLRRRHPDEDEPAREERLRAWLQDRDGHSDPPDLRRRVA